MLVAGVALKPHFHLFPLCEEKKRLRTLYRLEDERHRRAVNEVLRVRGKVPEKEYDRVRARVDEARNTRNAARLALDQHKKEHGC